jgi:hypothetical protein
MLFRILLVLVVIVLRETCEGGFYGGSYCYCLCTKSLRIGAGVAEWIPEEDIGNGWRHSVGDIRCRIEVQQDVDAVKVYIPWRRRDFHPETKDVLLYNAATAMRVYNIFPVNITRYIPSTPQSSIHTLRHSLLCLT